MPDELEWLMSWYRAQCDGEWEHRYGIEIRTLDNPGWSLKVDLYGTSLDGVPFESISRNVEQNPLDPQGDWFDCRVKDRKYEAYGGASELPLLIRIFRQWVEVRAGTI